MTNRLPRQLANRAFAWFSRIESPALARIAIAAWRRFGDLDLADSVSPRFVSVHDCFTRRLKPGARPVDPDPSVITSPCDAIVGVCGTIAHDRLIQAKGLLYTLHDLLLDSQLVDSYIDGRYVTLRLTAGMYHRFHAPCDCRIERATHIAGDTWNVNPAALARIPMLFCKNERVVIPLALQPGGLVVTVVAVAAILVGGIRLHFADVAVDPEHPGRCEIACCAALHKGEEMGWFEHGSTLIVFAPKGVALCHSVRPGAVIRMGKPLMRLR